MRNDSDKPTTWLGKALNFDWYSTIDPFFTGLKNAPWGSSYLDGPNLSPNAFKKAFQVEKMVVEAHLLVPFWSISFKSKRSNYHSLNFFNLVKFEKLLYKKNLLLNSRTREFGKLNFNALGKIVWDTWRWWLNIIGRIQIRIWIWSLIHS